MQYLIEIGGRTDGFAQTIPQHPRAWVQDTNPDTGASLDTYSMQYIKSSSSQHN